MEVPTEREPKFHRDICRRLSGVVKAVVKIFPALEAVRPGCSSGIKALSGLCLALERAKSLLHYCAESSKLYLAITGESIIMRFEKVKACLEHNLKELESIVSESLALKVALVLKEISEVRFFLDPSDREVGREIMSLLTHEKGNLSDASEAFVQISRHLGFSSPRPILDEKKALQRLHEKAKKEGDTKKESILLYFLYLLRHHSKSIKSYSSNALKVGEEAAHSDSGSFRASSKENFSKNLPGRGSRLKPLSNLADDKTRYGRFNSAPLIPEEFRCPLSLGVMLEPVVIASGQTYERNSIEEWFRKGHNTCPKTHQELPHFSLIPNNCMKNLITRWCEESGLQAWASSSPPSSCSSPLSSSSSVVSWGSDSISSLAMVSEAQLPNICQQQNKKIQDAPKIILEIIPDNPPPIITFPLSPDLSVLLGEHFMKLSSSTHWETRCGVAKEINSLLLNSMEIPLNLGEASSAEVLFLPSKNSHIEVLVEFLSVATRSSCIEAQTTALSILLRLADHNRGNNVVIEATGAIPLLLDILKETNGNGNSKVKGGALAILRSLSGVEENRARIAATFGAVPILVELLGKREHQHDALKVLCDLSSIPELGAVVAYAAAKAAAELVGEFPEECLLLLYHLASSSSSSSKEEKEEGLLVILGLLESGQNSGLLAMVVEVLEGGTSREKEYAVALLLSLCSNSSSFGRLVLEEGPVPALVALSTNGTTQAKEKAKRLLQLFRTRRVHTESSLSLPNPSPAIASQ